MKAAYKRTGRCQPKKCGAICCRLTAVNNFSKEETEYIKFYEIHGYKKIKIGNRIVMYLEQACLQLNKTKCNIHENKPNPCKVFPEVKSLMWFKLCKKLGCTYRFKKVTK